MKDDKIKKYDKFNESNSRETVFSKEIYVKKIFFLYPISIIYDLSKDLIKYGYEVYIIKDHMKLMNLLKKYPNSIVYVNIFEKMTTDEWEEYIKMISENPVYSGVQLGICVYRTSEDSELSQKYLIDYGLSGGYINLHISYKKSLTAVLKILAACEARGKRKYVRVKPFRDDGNTTVIINQDNLHLKGQIIDISVFCMAVEFDSSYFVKNQVLRNCLIKLRGVLCNSDLVVMGYQENKNNIYILVFLNKNDSFTDKIFEYIFERLQTEIQDFAT